MINGDLWIDMLFYIVCTLHILIWIFIVFAFVNIKTAYINMYFVIPAIYLLHILPFHVLIETKKQLKGDKYTYLCDQYHKLLVFPEIFSNVSKRLDKICTFNPISPQGMLIFGLITSIYRLYPPF